MLFQAIFILLGLVALGIPIAAALAWLALSLNFSFSSSPLYLALGDIAWQNSTEFLLVAIPMFVLLGELLLRSGIASKMYEGMVQWLSWLPGGLMHSNIGACSLFAATSGSSVATAATIGTVALPEVQKRNYNERLFLGTLAAGGTLGILIPPSINLILYGLLTDTSVPELYLAGFLPGLLLAGLFMLTVIVACFFRKSWGGSKVDVTWKTRIGSLPGLLPPLGIFLVVVGSIYAGLATPTEAASLGVVAALGLAAANKTLSIDMLKAAIEGTMRTTAMIMLIILAAIFLNFILATIGLTQALTQAIVDLGWTPFQTMLMIIGFLILLGCFMETLSMLLTTAPLLAPIVIQLGYDPVWFGILLMVLLETALITPPIGINLYVVQGIRKDGRLNDVMIGALPFVLTMFVMIGLLLAFPDIALWMPSLVYPS
ncbi:TRAP transporter large permease subunit [Sneathiella chungangensis]|uniref:TRAP transporter large permease protein n=1 Tax=Sneathiella chungangensis TaxID=1418234 RepID=A0A845M8W6_9PROT|nr:TRAP transporter large permease [Sneathiella chungangensis]MZR21058.1 TRAP transporter large permease subunit [Sneathiella chungangensis]